MRSQVALLMLLRATDVLAQNSAGKDGSKHTAIFYAETGLGLLAESDGMALLVVQTCSAWPAVHGILSRGIEVRHVTKSDSIVRTSSYHRELYV